MKAQSCSLTNLKIKTPLGVVALRAPFKVQPKAKTRLRFAVQNVLEENTRPAEELLDYIKRLTPSAGSTGGIIRGYLTANGWSQKNLSEKTEIAPSHLSEMIAGKRPIGVKIAKKLGKAFKVDYRRFL
ncbi:MAG: helix-turn-helix transcriptional regulator [Deltaproteobacteria bacterium]|nr:helix-turn-helix transcriptional regulator [Deltaproteobacteria bacterium]